MRNRKTQRMVRRGEISHEQTAKREKPISYRNSEGYADPTAYAAVKNMVKKQPRN